MIRGQDQLVSKLEKQVVRSDANMVATKIELDTKEKENIYAAKKQQEKIELLQFERDEIEINLMDQIDGELTLLFLFIFFRWIDIKRILLIVHKNLDES